jgi:hypothetical protein
MVKRLFILASAVRTPTAVDDFYTGKLKHYQLVFTRNAGHISNIVTIGNNTGIDKTLKIIF